MKAVAAVLVEHSARADAQGIAPEWWKANVSLAGENNLSAVERMERRLAAIPAEIKERKVNAKLAAFQEPKNAKRVLQEASKRAEEVGRSVPEIFEASNLVRQFVADLQLMAGSTSVPHTMRVLTSGTEQAARALGKPVPEMPGLPDGLPTRNEIDEVIALLAGRSDGFSQRYRVLVEDATKVQELARKLA